MDVLCESVHMDDLELVETSGDQFVAVVCFDGWPSPRLGSLPATQLK